MGAFSVNLVLVIMFGIVGVGMLGMLVVALGSLYITILEEWAKNWKLILVIGGGVGVFLMVCFVVAWWLTFYALEGGVMGG